MKLRPPAVKIDLTDPFKGALFKRKGFAESLTRLLQNTTDSPVIFVNAPWGEGKTTFAQRWLALLEQQKFKAIYFDAYATDYSEDPFVSFTGEILRLIKEQFPQAGAITERGEEFKRTAIEIGKRLSGLGAKFALSTLTRGAVDLADLKKITEIGPELTNDIATIGSEFVEKKIEDYVEEKNALVAFRDSLTKLALAVREQQGFPLTIVIDELDRCRPDFALGLLERIKHLFEVDNVAFVLLVNQDQIESYICSVYGVKMDSARSYLLKFATLFVDLPRQHRGSEYALGHVEYGRELAEHFDLPDVAGLDTSQIGEYVGVLSAHLKLTLREMERLFVVLALYLGSDPNPHFSMATFLAALKVKKPGLYNELRGGSLELQRFLAETRLEVLAKEYSGGINFDWVYNLFRFHLLSDVELEALPEAQKPQGMERLRLHGRHDVIPRLCEALDRFSVRPS